MNPTERPRCILALVNLIQVRVWALFESEAWVDFPGYPVLIVERRRSVLERIRRRGRAGITELWGKARVKVHLSEHRLSMITLEATPPRAPTGHYLIGLVKPYSNPSDLHCYLDVLAQQERLGKVCFWTINHWTAGSLQVAMFELSAFGHEKLRWEKAP